MTTTRALSYVAIGLLILIGFWWWRTTNTVTPVLFKTERPTSQHLKQYVTATGTLKARDQITVGALVAGRVISVDADDNDVVTKGQQLALLDDGVGDSSVKRLQAQLDEQQANLFYQEKFYARQKSLFETGQLSTDRFERETRDFLTAQARVDRTKAELEIQQKRYNNLFIKAPDDGIIIARKIDLGQMITSQFQATELFIIAKDLRQMEAHLDVDEADVGLVKEGQEALFSVDSFPDQKYNAVVKQIQYLARTIENVVTYATILDIDNPDLTLRPGMTTNVEILVAQAQKALSVPNKAFRISTKAIKMVAEREKRGFKPLSEEKVDDNFDTLWVLDNGSFVQKKVALGVTQRKHTQVLDGLTLASEVIIEAKEPPRENLLLKRVFGGAAGGIGKK